MKKKKKILLLISITSFILLSQIVPVYAAIDGGIVNAVKSSSSQMRSVAGGGSLIMTMVQYECYNKEDYPYNSYTGWTYSTGWKSTTGSVVGGYVNNTLASTLPRLVTKCPLSIFHSENPNDYYGQDVPANALLNSQSVNMTYSNMLYLKLYDYIYNNMVFSSYDFDSDGSVFVHPNFRADSPSSYYVWVTL